MLGFNSHKSSCVAAFDFATLFGCDQLVVGPTHARGETLDLLMGMFLTYFGLLL